MEISALCDLIGLQPEGKARVTALDRTLPQTDLIRGLLDPATAWKTYRALEALCPGDDLGFTMLTYQLRAAGETYRRYREKGISPAIFAATMGCYQRFLREHLQSYGCYGFDRGWWSHRQLSMTLFRLGELELEFRDEEKLIHLHIPSDAKIDLSACRASYLAMENFVAEYYPQRLSYRYCVDSWLLSPALKKVLGPGSRILAFQDCFTVEHWEQTGNEFMEWVYGRLDIPYESLPETTTLQRNLKPYLLSGGQIGSAWGYLKDGFR